MKRLFFLFNKQEKNIKILTNSLKIIGIYLSGEDQIAKFLIENKILDIFKKTIQISDAVAHSAWCIGNLLCNNFFVIFAN